MKCFQTTSKLAEKLNMKSLLYDRQKICWGNIEKCGLVIPQREKRMYIYNIQND